MCGINEDYLHGKICEDLEELLKSIKHLKMMNRILLLNTKEQNNLINIIPLFKAEHPIIVNSVKINYPTTASIVSSDSTFFKHIDIVTEEA